MNKQEFLNLIALTIKENPLWAPETVQSCNHGLSEAFDELNIAKSNIEVALFFAVSKDYKQKRHGFIKEKLMTVKKYWSLNWDWFFKEDKK